MAVKFFMDTSVIYAALSAKRRVSIFALSIILQNRIPLFTNEYAIKELRRVMAEFNYKREQIEKIIDFIRKRLSVVKSPSKEELYGIALGDKSDAPIVKSAEKLSCILISEDRRLRVEANKYIPAISSEEAVRLFSIELVRLV